MALRSDQQQLAPWIRLSLIWRWPLAVLLSAAALGHSAAQLLSKPVPVAISGAIPLTIAVSSRLPVSVQAEQPGGLQTQLSSPAGGLAVAPIKLGSPIRTNVQSAGTLPVTAQVSLSTPVALNTRQQPLRVEVQPSGQPMPVEVERMDMLP
jgi:hypothetical protein